LRKHEIPNGVTRRYDKQLTDRENEIGCTFLSTAGYIGYGNLLNTTILKYTISDVYVQEVGGGRGDWKELAQEGRVAGTCEYGKEPSGSIKCGEFLD
jgi:hypothetical protein